MAHNAPAFSPSGNIPNSLANSGSELWDFRAEDEWRDSGIQLVLNHGKDLPEPYLLFAGVPAMLQLIKAFHINEGDTYVVHTHDWLNRIETAVYGGQYYVTMFVTIPRRRENNIMQMQQWRFELSPSLEQIKAILGVVSEQLKSFHKKYHENMSATTL